jgi:hypothetical protein
MLLSDSLTLPSPVLMPDRYSAEDAERCGDENAKLLDDASFAAVALQRKGDPREARTQPGRICLRAIGEAVDLERTTHSSLAETAAHDRLLDASAIFSQLNRIIEAARSAYLEADRLFVLRQGGNDRGRVRIQGKLQRLPRIV